MQTRLLRLGRRLRRLSRQRNRRNIHGYNYDSGGFNLGFGYSVGRFDFSLFGGYAKGKLKLRDLAAKYDAGIMNLGLSAAYTHGSGLYGKAVFGCGRGWNDYDANWALGGMYHGKFDNYSVSAGGKVGYIARTDIINVIPSAGLTCTHYSQKVWSESYCGTGPATPHWFAKQRLNTVDIPLGVRMNTIFCLSVMEIVPEIRAAWIYSAKRDNAKVDVEYQGGGVKARFKQNWDANLGCNFTFRSKYAAHAVPADIGCSF